MYGDQRQKTKKDMIIEWRSGKADMAKPEIDREDVNDRKIYRMNLMKRKSKPIGNRGKQQQPLIYTFAL